MPVSASFTAATEIAPVRGSWKPATPRASCMSGGGTSPIRDPGGKTASAAKAPTGAKKSRREAEKRSIGLIGEGRPSG